MSSNGKCYLREMGNVIEWEMLSKGNGKCYLREILSKGNGQCYRMGNVI